MMNLERAMLNKIKPLSACFRVDEAAREFNDSLNSEEGLKYRNIWQREIAMAVPLHFPNLIP
jgi:hypothetical protein